MSLEKLLFLILRQIAEERHTPVLTCCVNLWSTTWIINDCRQGCLQACRCRCLAVAPTGSAVAGKLGIFMDTSSYLKTWRSGNRASMISFSLLILPNRRRRSSSSLVLVVHARMPRGTIIIGLTAAPTRKNYVLCFRLCTYSSLNYNLYKCVLYSTSILDIAYYQDFFYIRP